MARILNTLSMRMVLALVLIHAILLPALFYALYVLAKSSQEDAFVDHVRMSARIFADTFHMGDELDSETEIIKHLDGASLGGTGIFAAMQIGDRTLLSSLLEPEEGDLFVEDFHFGEHDDDIYYLSIPLEISGGVAVLRLGFDEWPTLEHVGALRQTLIYILLTYFIVSLVLVLLLGMVLARPLQELRRDSSEIASGNYSKQLAVSSNIHEIRELTRDLETMRSNLVGSNALLRKEIVEREAAEKMQRGLETRLRHSQRIESIGTLAGGIAHEINNILLPLLLYTDLALEDLPDVSPVRAKLKRVLKLGNRAKGLSQQILTFSRQAGDTDRKVQLMEPVVEEALAMVRALIPATVDIRVDIKKGQGRVLCDETQIVQLVVNLCNNAFHAVSRNGGYIEVNLNGCDVDEVLACKHTNLRVGKYLRLEITDTGEGIDSATLERIFDPFFTTREVGKGTGLGLSVVHGIVVDHDAELVVSSKLGLGSTFCVYFPQAEEMVADSTEDQA